MNYNEIVLNLITSYLKIFKLNLKQYQNINKAILETDKIFYKQLSKIINNIKKFV